MRRFEYETIRALVPASHAKLVEHIRKESVKREKKKTEMWNKKNGVEIDDDDDGDDGMRISRGGFERALYGDGHGDDDGDDDNSKGARKGGGKGSGGGGGSGGDTAMEETGDKPSKAQRLAIKRKHALRIVDETVDFGAAAAGGKVVRGDGGKKRRREEAPTFDANGKLVFGDGGKQMYGGDAKKNGKAGAGDEPVNMSQSQLRAAKRQRGNDGGRQTLRLGSGRAIDSSGAMYRATKGGGDIKVAGAPEPFAYVPLNPRMMNRRQKTKATRQFESVVGAARKGADKAKKIRGKKAGKAFRSSTTR
jgi:ribosomal RNA-processing protein 12